LSALILNVADFKENSLFSLGEDEKKLMKFLLKQHLNYKQIETIFFLYPNQFSSIIIKEANKKDLILEKNYTFRGKYRIIQSYLILENDFRRLLNQYKHKIKTKRTKFYGRSYLEQLILILRYMFNRNSRAKEVSKRWAKYKAYDDKQEFLKLALEIAAKIKNKDFSYGWQEDPGAINFEYVYYFQLGKKQVSFHSAELYLDAPEFHGKWIGYRNERFPMGLSQIKQFI